MFYQKKVVICFQKNIESMWFLINKTMKLLLIGVFVDTFEAHVDFVDEKLIKLRNMLKILNK